MSALGQKQTFELAPVMSALLPKADIPRGDVHVRLSAKSGHWPWANALRSLAMNVRSLQPFEASANRALGGFVAVARELKPSDL